MKNTFLIFLSISFSSLAQFSVGHTTITFNDPARTGGFGSGGGNGRQIQTEIYYPSTSSGTNTPFVNGEFPIIVFGHGFAMTWDAYSNIWDHFVPRGYIMAFVRTESSLFPSPSHNDFGLDLKLVAEKMLTLPNSNALFQNHVYPKVGLMGHSMGGGASFLAANSNGNIHALIGLAPAETTPSAIAASPNVLVPSIVFSGSSDGVTPPDQHHIPLFNGIASNCKTFVSITGGGHCYFANTNFNCDFGESTSSTGISISRTEQQLLTFEVLDPWVDYILKDSCGAYEDFQMSLTNTAGIVGQTTCPTHPMVDITQNGSILQTSAVGTSYQWFLYGQLIPGATANFYDMGQNPGGVYRVQVIYPFGCGVSPNLNILGVKNPLLDVISFTPNPTKDFIRIFNESKDNLHTTLFSMNGEKLMDFCFDEPENKLDLSQLSPGMYLLQFEQNGYKRMDKIIRE
jgi:hypothetical protein